MTGFLARQVLRSALDPNLKPLAVSLAVIGPDDGARIFPSTLYLAWLLGLDPRTVRAKLAELRGLKIIEAQGRRGRATCYRFNVANLPRRPSWAETRSGSLDPLAGAAKRIPGSAQADPQIRESGSPDPPMYKSDDLSYGPSPRPPQRKRNKLARPGPEPERQAPNRLREAIAAVDQIMDPQGCQRFDFDRAIATIASRAEYADRYHGEDFIGTVIFYFRQARGLDLAAGGKVKA